MRTHFNPKNNPRVIIIQKLYGKFYNEDNDLDFPKHRFKKWIPSTYVSTDTTSFFDLSKKTSSFNSKELLFFLTNLEKYFFISSNSCII